MARLDPSIRHAITPPEFGADKLHRAELVDRLHGEIPRKLVAIAAPAGYGKTTLLADFAAHTELPVVWVQINDSDQDLMRLIGVFSASLEKRFRRLRGKFDIHKFAGSSPESLAALFAELINTNIPENFILIFDEVHLLHQSEDALTFLDQLILHLPEQATLFASGREVIEVSLARLMAEGDLAGFGPQDLALRWDETSKLIELISGKNIDEDLVVEVQEKTRGWATGIVLYEYSADQVTLEAGLSESLIYEYLSSVVLNSQADELRRFMIDASVLPVMSVKGCREVLGADDAGALLGKLESKNLFITAAPGSQRTYEFHPLFRNHLKRTLKVADPERYQLLQSRAANYLSSASPEVAFYLYCELEDLESAAKVAEAQASYLFLSGRFQTILAWIEALGPKLNKVPLLAYYYSVMLSDRGEINRALETLEQILGNNPQLSIWARSVLEQGFCYLKLGRHVDAQKSLDKFAVKKSDISDNVIVVYALRLEARLRAFIGKDYQGAAKLLDSGLRLIGDENHVDLEIKLLQDQTQYFGISGALDKARRAVKRSLELASKVQAPLSQIPSYINLSHIEYLDGRFQEALQTLEETRNLAIKAGSPRQEAEVIAYQADVYSDVGMAFQAANLYSEALSIASNIDDWNLLAHCCLGASALHRRNGNYRLANDWFGRAAEFLDGRETAQAVNQKAAILIPSNPREAANLLNKLDRSDGKELHARDLAIREYLLASAYHSYEKDSEAIRSMERCLEFSSLNGATQYIAAELLHDISFREWVFAELSGSSALHGLSRQLELIEAFLNHYQNGHTEPEVEEGIQARALGNARLIWRGEIITELKPQAMELFFMLIDLGSVERDQIIEEFWPDHPPGRQTANLHMAVYSIRRIIGKDRILLKGTVYELDPSIQVNYDVKQFEQALAAFRSLPPGDPRCFFALTEAVNKYQGHFLPEFYSDWVEDRRRDLELQYLDIASHHADESLKRKQPSHALLSLRNALRIDPYRDDLNLRYLQVLVELGRRSEVISHYRNYSQMLREDLGLAPADSVKDLHERVING